MIGAGESLAKAALDSGNAAAAAGAWLKLTELDPLRARFTVAYMNALAAQGDRAGALAHARKHEEIVRRELDPAPDPEVVELAQRLRRGKTAVSVIPSAISPERPPAPSPPTALPAPIPTRSSPLPSARLP